jgi:hypothetical protein
MFVKIEVHFHIIPPFIGRRGIRCRRRSGDRWSLSGLDAGPCDRQRDAAVRRFAAVTGVDQDNPLDEIQTGDRGSVADWSIHPRPGGGSSQSRA